MCVVDKWKEPPRDKTNNVTVRPAKTQISLGIRPVWSESSLCAQWVAKMDGWVRVLRPFDSISVISRRWKGEHERLCAMKRRLGSGRISPPAGFEPATPWSEVGRANQAFFMRMPRLIWVFAGRTATLLVLSRGGSKYKLKVNADVWPDVALNNTKYDKYADILIKYSVNVYG